MRIVSLLLLFFVTAAFTSWETNFEKARLQASAEHKYILLNFSGSDWCGPCIKMHHDFFESADFITLSNKNLVLVNADFPRQKKNQLSKLQQQQNDQLADKYNAAGSFPLTLLLNADGTVIKKWDGYPRISVAEFIGDIKKITDAAK